MTDRDCTPLQLTDFKAGDSFSLIYGVPLSFAATISTVESTINSNHGFSFGLTVVKIADDTTHSRWQITALNTDTILWPLTLMKMDIKRTFNDATENRTQTFLINIIKGETP